MRRLVLVSLSLLAVAVLAGCAGANTSATSFKGTERDVADAVGDLQKAGQRKDEGKICTQLLTRELALSMRAGRSTCEAEVSDALSDADDFDLTVKDVTVAGPRATAQVENNDRAFTLGLQRVGAAWRISSLGG